jgi:hypothetical protein
MLALSSLAPKGNKDRETHPDKVLAELHVFWCIAPVKKIQRLWGRLPSGSIQSFQHYMAKSGPCYIFNKISVG